MTETTQTAALQRDVLMDALQRFLFDLGMTENLEQSLPALAEAFREVAIANGIDHRLTYRALEAARSIHRP